LKLVEREKQSSAPAYSRAERACASTCAGLRGRPPAEAITIVGKPSLTPVHNRAGTAEALHARLTFTQLRQRLHPFTEPSATKSLIADLMLVVQRCRCVRGAARMSRIQAFGVTAVALSARHLDVAGAAILPPLPRMANSARCRTQSRTSGPGGMFRARASPKRSRDVRTCISTNRPAVVRGAEKTLSDLDL